MKKLCLIDGYGFVFRAYHSLPPLTRADGMPISCVYGFCNMLSKFLSNDKSDYLAVVLDSGKKNFRHDIFPQYKANRPQLPDDLIVQFPLIRETIEAFNITSLEADGYEADDLIAAYASDALKQGMEVKIISSDKDLMQLVCDNLKLLDPIKNVEIGEEQVVAKLGVKPYQVADYLALIGDSSDNVPGAKGIGPKTAIELLSKFESLDNIYANINNIEKDRLKNLLIESKDIVYLSKDLTNLKRNYNIDCDLDELKIKEPDNEKLAKYLYEQGFKSLVSKFIKEKATDIKFTQPKRNENFIKIEKLSEIKSHIEQIIREGKVGIFDNGNTFYFSYGNSNYEMHYNNYSRQESFLESESINYNDIIKEFKELFEATYVLKIVINAKELYKKLYCLNIELKAFDDIAQISYSLETGKHSCELNDLIRVYLGEEASHNSVTILRIYDNLQERLLHEKQFYLYESIEKPLSPILAKMEIKGVKVDGTFLKNLSQEFKLRLNELEKEIFKEAGREFLLSSPKQLGEVLFTELGIKGGKKSKSGTFSTGADILEKLSDQGYDIADKILVWRQFSKLINTYTDALPNSINPKTGRVHTTFMMTLTNTGRLSSRDPNLQNIPIRSDEGQKIRKAFVADKDHLIISADYSQIELRLLAHIADIQTLKQAFHDKQDIHAITASQIFGVALKDVDSNLRRQAKTINFGIVYGISAFGLAKRLDISQYEAKDYIDKYFKQYPGIKEYMDETIEYAKTHGYVKNLFGRKCYINGINDKNYSMRGFAERAAINAPLQSGNADIIKKAMVHMPESIQDYMVLQIHDELLFEIPENKLEEYSKTIKRVMEGACKISVPLEVEVHSARNWGK
ncbi:DNA polymerase I [Candidatus Jidaibacter acanthamoeba]|uniref:DNA polymerase I n=1 Tax=Candidatus Jidaibacter acanthamoebae TaxID=86105 RepID=A0A0C1QG45_9RICK|nr:DNA polymerase I [Candidatus Jidaibacter acanthamoeba]KIE04524.1 DNA polymerase I [Candidatus Jidaibacter acanthamoeba]